MFYMINADRIAEKGGKAADPGESAAVFYSGFQYGIKRYGSEHDK